MPTNMVICGRNALDYATVTASPAVLSSLPVTNLQLPARGRVVRSTSTAPQTYNFSWGGQGYYLNFLTLMRHNLESGATWRVQVFSDANFTTQIYNSGTVAAYDASTLGQLDFGVAPLGSGIFDAFLGEKFSVVYFPLVLALSVTITVTDTGNSAGYVEASRAYAGKYMELKYNPDSLSLGWDEATAQSRSAGGSLRSDGEIAFRSMDASVKFVDTLQRADLMDMARFAGARKDLFVSAFPGQGGEKERDYTMLCKFPTGKVPRFSEASDRYNILETQLSFLEA